MRSNVVVDNNGPRARRAGVVDVVASAQLSAELVAGDAQQIMQFVLATVHGLATMANGGMLGDEDVDAVVADAVERLLAGLRPR